MRYAVGPALEPECADCEPYGGTMPSTTGPRPTSPKRRTRLTAAQRREQIVEVATTLMAQHGYNGLSLQEVADGVGISQAGLLHYIDNKPGLLTLLLDERYDRRGTPQDFIDSGDPAATHPEGISLPAYFRYLVHLNVQRPELMRLHMLLGAEAVDPAHPAHAHFINRPDEIWGLYMQFTWRLPPEIKEQGGFESIRQRVGMALEVMDGIQVRYFRQPAVSLAEEWARFEPLLFPSPLWDGYR